MKRTLTVTETEKQIVYETEAAIGGRRLRYTLEVCFFKTPRLPRRAYVAVCRHALGQSDAARLHEDRVARSLNTPHSRRTNDEIERDALFTFGQTVEQNLAFLRKHEEERAVARAQENLSGLPASV